MHLVCFTQWSQIFSLKSELKCETKIEVTKYFWLRCSHPVNTKHLYDIYTTPAQRLQRWTNIVYILYKCFVFTG